MKGSRTLKSLGCIMSETKHQSGCAGKEALYGEQETDCNHWQTVWKRRQCGGKEAGRKAWRTLLRQEYSADNLFRFQSEVIRKLAAAESCVFIGRCADYVLEGEEGLVRVFLYADMEAREARIREKHLYEEKDLIKNIKRIDKERRDYHRYYTGRSWEDVGNYDLMLNTARLGIDGTVNVILHYLEERGLR